jgi:hypothetical protein
MSKMDGAFAFSAALLIAGLSCGKSTADGPDATPASVKECDEYLSRSEACFARMDSKARVAAERTVAAKRDAFAQSSGTAEGKVALAAQCAQLLQNLNPACK